MKIVFKIDGGIGKSVMATAVCKAIKARTRPRMFRNSTGIAFEYAF